MCFFSFQPVESSGYLQIGFFLYEFRHDAPFAPADDTAQRDENVTSGDVADDVVLGVEPWQLRSQIPGQAGAGDGAEPPSNASAAPPLPWRQATACNVTATLRPQYRFLLCLDYVHR